MVRTLLHMIAESCLAFFFFSSNYVLPKCFYYFFTRMCVETARFTAVVYILFFLPDLVWCGVRFLIKEANTPVQEYWISLDEYAECTIPLFVSYSSWGLFFGSTKKLIVQKKQRFSILTPLSFFHFHNHETFYIPEYMASNWKEYGYSISIAWDVIHNTWWKRRFNSHRLLMVPEIRALIK